MSQDTKKKMKVRWVCDKEECKHTNHRTIGLTNVIFEDTCDMCNRYIQEPIVKIIKE